MIEPTELVAHARTWIGVPFRHQGRTRAGVDCAGFIVEMMKACGELPSNYHEPANYGRSPSGHLIEIVRKYCTVAPPPAFAAALVLIKWSFDRVPSHVGICTGETLIHSYAGERAVIEHGYRGRWLRLTHSLWRLPGVRYE